MENGRVGSVQSLGDIDLTGTFVHDVNTTGNLMLRTGQWDSGNITAGTISYGPAWLTNYAPKTRKNAPAPAIPAMLQLINSDDAAFNAWQYSGSANYVFYMVGGTPWVYVRNVKGVSDGKITLSALKAQLSGDGRNLSKLTTSTAADGTPEWTIRHANASETTFVPGVAMFVGDLYVEQGKYYNTFVATRNLYTTDGNQYIFPPNYATGAASVNPGDASGNVSMDGLCTLVHKPTNFCPADGLHHNEAGSGMGSYALMAGSYNGGGINALGSVTLGSFNPASPISDYVGGNIWVGKAVTTPTHTTAAGPTWAWGYVLAGNAIDTTATQSRIYGKILAQGFAATAPGALLGAMGLGGNTIIDLTNVPLSVRGMGLGTGEAGSSGTPAPGVAPLNAAPAVALAVGNAGRGTMGTADSMSVVAGVAGAPQFLSAATLQANAAAGAPQSSGPVAVTIVNATFN
jgi:hypothetical protein